MTIKFRLIYIFAVLYCLAFSSVNAAVKTPDIVTFGIYPVAIYDIDPIDGSFMISFYAWWRTTNKNYKPADSIEIVNSQNYSHKFGTTGKVGNEYFTYVHYYAKINQTWNSKYFPFGRQFLQVKMEDFSDIKSVVFKPDNLESKLHSEFTLPGWNIIGLTLKQSVTDYATNFGDASAPRSLYSRLTFIIEIKRDGWRLYISYFIGFFMAGVLVHLLYLMNSFPYPGRATIFIGSVFSFVGNKYILDQRMPPSAVFTLADVIQITTFFAMIISIVTCIIAEKIESNIKKRNRISHTVGLISLTAYVGVIVWCTYLAVIS